jgi:hypothetical protein
MKKVQVYITAKVVGTITVPDNTTDEDIKNGFADIYFYPANKPHLEKEDLGADEFTVDILPVEKDPNQIELKF